MKISYCVGSGVFSTSTFQNLLQLFTINSHGAVLVSTGVVRLDKRAVAPNHDKMGNFLNLTDNNTVALAA